MIIHDYTSFTAIIVYPALKIFQCLMVFILAAIFLVSFDSLAGAFGYVLCKEVEQFEMTD